MKIAWRVAVIAALAGPALMGCEPYPAQGQTSSPSAGNQATAPRAAKVDPALTKRLGPILVPLLAKMDHPIPPKDVKIGLTADSHINAGNAGGGNFLVTTGLLQKANDDRLRSILAHEVAHADLGHVAQQQTISTGIEIGTMLLDQLFPGSRAVTPLAGQLIELHYSRGDEIEADAHAVEILRRAGYDGKRLMADALDWLAKTEGTSSGGFFATHPATGDRIQAVQRLP